MFLPIGTDRPHRRFPLVNTALIVGNILIFLGTMNAIGTIDQLMIRGFSLARIAEQVPVLRFYLLPVDAHEHAVHQFFSYQFLHGDWEHLLGNMLFLYVFGSAVEDRLGRLAYLAFYLAGGVLAGLGYMVFGHPSPMLGASGAIAAVTGAYLALFPLSRVTITFLFVYFWQVSSLLLVMLYVAYDVTFAAFGRVDGVAYLAHICGYISGFAVGIGLLYFRFLDREIYDFVALVDRWNRRRQMRVVTRQGDNPWLGRAGKGRKNAKPFDADDEKLAAARQAVSEALADNQPQTALDRYEALIADHPEQVLPRDTQFDLAGYAMNHDRHPAAAHGYERFLEHYAHDPRAPEVRLLLALIYIRYVNRPQDARPLLETALDRLHDPGRKSLAQQLLDEITRE